MKATIDFLTFLFAEFDVPSMVLAVMGLFGVWVMIRAQRRDDFDWGDALKDETGKLSAMRLAVFVSLAISSWLLIYIAMNAVKSAADLDLLFKFFIAYLAIWSGAKIVERALDIILAKYAGAALPAKNP